MGDNFRELIKTRKVLNFHVFSFFFESHKNIYFVNTLMVTPVLYFVPVIEERKERVLIDEETEIP